MATMPRGCLTTLAEKCARFEALGVDVLAVVPFDEKLRQMAPNAFVEQYLSKWLNACHVVVGYDHGFGKDREGGYATMQALGNRFGFGVTSVDPNLVDGSPISSTRIRRALEENRFGEAVLLLGEHFPVWGQVEKGEGRGARPWFSNCKCGFGCGTKVGSPFGRICSLGANRQTLPSCG